jgi:hypothetical protein
MQASLPGSLQHKHLQSLQRPTIRQSEATILLSLHSSLPPLRVRGHRWELQCIRVTVPVTGTFTFQPPLQVSQRSKNERKEKRKRHQCQCIESLHVYRPSSVVVFASFIIREICTNASELERYLWLMPLSLGPAD